jgi:hypothetical protein
MAELWRGGGGRELVQVTQLSINFSRFCLWRKRKSRGIRPFSWKVHVAEEMDAAAVLEFPESKRS